MFAIANLIKHHKFFLALLFLSVICYLIFGYDLVRTDTSKLLVVYIALFSSTFFLIQHCKFYNLPKGLDSFKVLAGVAIGFRLLFLFATPNLSQDFYRFIWDGRMILEGFNPYLFTPDSFILKGNFPIAQAQELHKGMGALSASHYTNYPPLNQLCFAIAALFSGKSVLGSVVIMRIIIIAADIGTLYFGKKLLERLKLPSNRIFWFILNPFIIIELTGNLHFEGVMIFFLIWSLYVLHSGRWKWAAVLFACSISVKLIPLMFLPLFYGWFTSTSFRDHNNTSRQGISVVAGIKRLMQFYGIVGVITLLLFIPFFSMAFIDNYANTVGLWFGNFEFNASIYYLARAIGYAITGFNEIAIITKILPIITVLIILWFSFFRPHNTMTKFITALLLVFSFYLFLSTTVHPWYVATLVILCVFTDYKYPIIWSLALILSYLAYSNTANAENLLIIGLEYAIVFGVFLWELVFKNRRIKKANT
ncbi:MAG: mannosyltransferase [Winogradskyella sp.]|uniref:mannosyltransferase n=1 Tax=Winogradskyella sp. TaxID=1883156 RepID=UPI001834CD6E|nr:mannosyltransferase [Winogradskyella sp.]